MIFRHNGHLGMLPTPRLPIGYTNLNVWWWEIWAVMVMKMCLHDPQISIVIFKRDMNSWPRAGYLFPSWFITLFSDRIFTRQFSFAKNPRKLSWIAKTNGIVVFAHTLHALMHQLKSDLRSLLWGSWDYLDNDFRIANELASSLNGLLLLS